MTLAKKYKIFQKVTATLNSVEIIPIIFGSFGLNMVIGSHFKANDIDFLVPSRFIKEEWIKLKSIIQDLGFKLIDEKEHEFEKDGEVVAFAKQTDLDELVKINPEDLKIRELEGVKFKELSARQYLACYKTLQRDTYRRKKKVKLIKRR